MEGHLCGVWKWRDRGSGLGGDGGSGCNGVREGVRGQKNGLRLVWKWTPARVVQVCEKGYTRVQAKKVRGGAKKTKGVWP